MNISPETPVQFKCGATMKNRFMLAPMTNTQSHEDGTLSEDEFKWLTMRAEGQFGLVMTCAAHVQENGKGFPGQLGIFSDEHIEGHKRLAAKIQSYGSLAVVQLHHAGMRSPAELVQGLPVCPSDNEKYGCRGLSIEEVEQLKQDFIDAAIRAKKCGYDGVEVHGAHGYILTQFLSSEFNKRTDKYGGSLENRARLLFEIVDGIRTTCGKEFLLSVRLSPERFGMDLLEVKEVCQRFIDEDKIDFLDISLWDIFKMPEEKEYQDKSLLDHFTDLDYKNIKLTVAGKIKNGEDVKKALNSGIDFVSIGQSAILHHDFPAKVMENPNFEPTKTPVSAEYLKKEGLGKDFINYMSKWEGFVEN
ncbi:NADH:flavin oxidoreductase [Brumimicrobium glaciale]|uniref:NADH:flavin oxidoreductase n=1 Tax=Brumimicrobium glaciale TaxID=200475 RepID=A0A4Q4KR17_9FLAO|nr:NADH:flavin oxidoreductase [Brumimicrobium glaciale]RYM36088.1 NADH:flavin oxidoreductase [Brumimicrobium glaciale]